MVLRKLWEATKAFHLSFLKAQEFALKRRTLQQLRHKSGKTVPTHISASLNKCVTNDNFVLVFWLFVVHLSILAIILGKAYQNKIMEKYGVQSYVVLRFVMQALQDQ